LLIIGFNVESAQKKWLVPSLLAQEVPQQFDAKLDDFKPWVPDLQHYEFLVRRYEFNNIAKVRFNANAKFHNRRVLILTTSADFLR